MELFKITAFLPWPFSTNRWLSQVSTQCQEDKAWKPGILLIHQTPPPFISLHLNLVLVLANTEVAHFLLSQLFPASTSKTHLHPDHEAAQGKMSHFSPSASAQGIGEHTLMKSVNWPTSQVAMSDTADAKSVHLTLLKISSA